MGLEFEPANGEHEPVNADRNSLHQESQKLLDSPRQTDEGIRIKQALDKLLDNKISNRLQNNLQAEHPNGLQVSLNYDGGYVISQPNWHRLGSKQDSPVTHYIIDADRKAVTSTTGPKSSEQKGTARINKDGGVVLDMTGESPWGQTQLIIKPDGSVVQTYDKFKVQIEYPKDGRSQVATSQSQTEEEYDQTNLHIGSLSQKALKQFDQTEVSRHYATEDIEWNLMDPQPKEIMATPDTTVISFKNGSINATRGNESWIVDGNGNYTHREEGSEDINTKIKPDDFKHREYIDHWWGKTPIDRSTREVCLKLPEFNGAKLTLTAYYDTDTGKITRFNLLHRRVQQ